MVKSAACVLREGSERLIMGKSWQGWRWEVGNSIAKTTRGSAVHKSTHLADGPFLSRWTCRAARKGVRQSQPEFHMEPLRMENRHLLGSWLLAFPAMTSVLSYLGPQAP